MYKTAVFVLATLLSSTFASYVHNLDDEDHLQTITRSGVKISNYLKEAHFKVASNGGSTGYSWIVDYQSCDGIVDITTGYAQYSTNGEY